METTIGLSGMNAPSRNDHGYGGYYTSVADDVHARVIERIELQDFVGAAGIVYENLEHMDGGTVRQVVTLLCKHGMFEDAYTLVTRPYLTKHMKTTASTCTNRLLETLVSNRLFSMATRLASVQMMLIGPATIHNVIAKCSASRQVDAAISFFNSFCTRFTPRPKLVSSMISIIMESGGTPKDLAALAIHQSSTGMCPAPDVVLTFVCTALTNDDPFCAVEILQNAHVFGYKGDGQGVMQRIAQHFATTRPHELHYAAMICGDSEAIVGTRPTWMMFEPLLDVLKHTRDVVTLCDLLGSMQTKLHIAVKKQWVYSLVDALCKEHRVDLAEYLIRGIGAQDDIIMINHLINAVSSYYTSSKLDEIWEMMGQLGCKPSIFSWNCRLRNAYYCGGSDARSQVRRAMSHANVVVDSYTGKVLRYTNKADAEHRAKSLSAECAYTDRIREGVIAGKELEERGIVQPPVDFMCWNE